MSTPVMLAASEIPKLQDVKWPKLGSPKLDGIRCYLKTDVLSRRDKLIPNEHIRRSLAPLVGTGLDGELMIHGTDFNDVQSNVMSINGAPNFEFWVFDVQANMSALSRTKLYHKIVEECGLSFVKAVPQVVLNSAKAAEDFMTECVAAGHEGIILKDPVAMYKFGRSTLKQQIMLKYKYFFEEEGTVVGTYELLHNTDTSTKRQENMVPGNTLGGFHVQWNGHTFDVGGGKGMTQELRKQLWQQRDTLIGKKLTFKYQELSEYGVPRFPTYKVLRDARV